MLKQEFEKLIGRQIPTSVYLEIEEAYMDSDKDKVTFAEEWTAEKMDLLICNKYFEMEISVVKAEGEFEGLKNHFQKYQEAMIRDRERINNLYYDREKLYAEITEKDCQIKGLETEIQKLKAKLYDKKVA
jgi:chromosome segregation ATPase